MTAITRDATDLLPLDVNETDYVSFDYTDLLLSGETIDNTLVTVTCEVSTGVDGSAAARAIGAPVVGSSVVRQLMSGVLDGVVYLIRCRVTLTPTGRTLVLAGLLPATKVGT